MNRRLLRLLSFLAFFLPLTTSANSIVVTSQNIKSLLVGKNSKILATKLEKSAAEEREGSLTRSFFPSLVLYAGQESFKTGSLTQKLQPSYGAEARVNIFNGGLDKIENDVRALETKKLEYQHQRVSSEELEKARAGYWQSLYLQEKVSLLTATLEMNKQNLNSAQRRIKSGVATDSDRFEFEMKEVDLKRDLAETEIQLISQIRLLKILLGLGEGSIISFSEKLSHDHDYESMLNQSMKQHEFLFKEFEIEAEKQKLSVQSYHRTWWPKLDAFAAYNQYNQRIESAGPDASDDMRREAVLGLRMTMSFATGLEAQREANALSQKALASQTLANSLKQEVEVHLQGEIAELNFLHDQVHEAEQNIARAERYYKLTQSEYSRGVKNSPDVMGASEKLFEMRHKRLEIIKNFQISKAHVLSKIGQ